MKKRIIKITLFFCLIISSLTVYAIDPLGYKVNFDDDYNNATFPVGGFLLILVLVAIAFGIYLLYLKYQEYSKNRPLPKTIKMYSPEWWELEKRRMERQEKEGKGAMIGCVVGIIIFFGGIILSIIQTETEWMQAGKDLLTIFCGSIVLLGVFLLIGHIIDKFR